jgi:O-antigen/teichoic acid export membrane protein
MAKKIIRLAASYSAASAVGTIYLYAPLVATSLVASASATGLFGAAFRIFQVVAGIPVLLVTSAFPVLARAARADRARLEYATGRLLDVALILGAWMAVATYFFAPAAVAIVAGKDFKGSVPILQIQGVALFGGFLAITMGFALLSLGRHRALLVANAFGLATNVALTLVLVPQMGPKGAAVALVAGDVALCSTYAYHLVWKERIDPSWRLVPRVAIATLGAASLTIVPGVPQSALGVLATIVYFGIVALLGGIPPELRHAFVARAT